MKFPFHTLVFLLLAISLVSCAKPLADSTDSETRTEGKSQNTCKASLKTDGVCLDAIWETYPTETTVGSLLVFARSLNSDHLVKDFSTDPRVTLWMPSLGHGSSPVKVVPLQPGMFRIEKVFFIMRGDWEVRFQTPTDRAAWALDF